MITMILSLLRRWWKVGAVVEVVEVEAAAMRVNMEDLLEGKRRRLRKEKCNWLWVVEVVGENASFIA